MTNVGQYLKRYLFLSRKDLGILSAIFVMAFASSFVFLWMNNVYLQRLHLTMQVLGVIICILLGLNVSFFVFKLLSQPERMIPMLHSLQSNGVLRKTVSELVLLNILALTNFAFLTFSYVIDSKTIQMIAVSTSVATWPLFFLILMNMDGRFYSAKAPYDCSTAQNFCGMPVAENCGPAIVLSKTYEAQENDTTQRNERNRDDDEYKSGATAC